MAVDLRSGIVRILKPDGGTAGTGFLVSEEGLIATCAHVVWSKQARKRHSPRPDAVDVIFHVAGSRAEAVVEAAWWRDPDAEDVALLRLKGDLPDSVHALPLTSSRKGKGHGFETFGFPPANPTGGIIGDGDILGETTVKGMPVLQLRSGEVGLGFSGAPVWDKELCGVVGVVSSITPPDRYARLADTAFAIPAEMLYELAPHILLMEVVRPDEAPPFVVSYTHNPSFVGRRADLRDLHQALTGGGPTGNRVVGLTGMGGIGKTQLAVEYAHAHRDDYPHGIFWIEADKVLLDEFAGLAPALDLGDGRIDAEQAAHRVWKELDARPGALLIFDNVEKPADLKSPIAPGLVPANLPCHILFTTRHRDPRTFPAVEVKVLPEAAAMRLLLRGRPEELDEQHPGWTVARRICTSLGRLPLALELAAAFLCESPEVKLADYLQRLHDEGRLPVVDDTELDEADLPTRHKAAVEATLRAQWSGLDDEEAKLVFRAAGQLRKGVSIPLEWLELLTGIPAAASPGHASPLARAVRKLRAVSLIEELTDERLHLHALVHEFASRLTPDGEGQAFQSALETHVANALRERDLPRRRAIAAGEILLDLEQVPEWEPSALRAAVLGALRALIGEGHAWPADRRAAVLLLTRLRWLDDTQDIPPGELSGCLELIGRYLDLPADRRYLVEKITEVLDLQSETLSPRQRAQLLVYRAANWGYLGQPSEAATDYGQVEALLEELGAVDDSQPEDQRLMARVLLGKGVLRMYRAGLRASREERDQDLQEARDLQLEAARLARAYKRDPILEATIAKELCWDYALLREWQSAEDAYQRALQVLERVRAEDPEAYAHYCARVLETASVAHWEHGQLLEAQQDRAGARSEYETALDLAQQGVDHLAPWGESSGLVIAYVNVGDYLDALAAPPGSVRENWQKGLDMAYRLGLSDLERECQERLYPDTLGEEEMS